VCIYIYIYMKYIVGVAIVVAVAVVGGTLVDAVVVGAAVACAAAATAATAAATVSANDGCHSLTRAFQKKTDPAGSLVEAPRKTHVPVTVCGSDWKLVCREGSKTPCRPSSSSNLGQFRCGFLYGHVG
jgi:membrane protein implicated in regulation of membrane protease activity